MSFRLPPASHKARELMGDLSAVAVLLDPANARKLPTTMEARRMVLNATSKDPAIKRISVIVLRADNDQRWLISVGKRGGWRKEWNFGNGRD